MISVIACLILCKLEPHQKQSDNRAFVQFTSFILSVVNSTDKAGENGTRLGGGGRFVDLAVTQAECKVWCLL